MKLLIVGGVAGGASAAARARRLAEDAYIVLFERGPDVSFANCGLPYYVGGEIADRNKLLVVTPERLRSRFRLDVRIRSSVEAIDRSAKKVRVRDLASGREYEEAYDKLILAPGAAPLRPPIPGIDLARGLHACGTYKTWTTSRIGWIRESSRRSWWGRDSSDSNWSRTSCVVASPPRWSNCRTKCCRRSTRR